MASVKSYKGLNFTVILFQIFFLSITFSSFGQTQQSYRNHEEIDVGGGMKVEILKCTGEGPTEECDCIYFRDKRQNGTRMKQSADHLKEEERAAALVKNINIPGTKKSKTADIRDLTGNRADKSIPASIAAHPKVHGAKREVTLEEAVRQADSVATVNSKKLEKSLSDTGASEDSTEMDKVYIPKVTETGATQLEESARKVNTENTAPTDQSKPVVKEIPKEVPVDSSSFTHHNAPDEVSKAPAIKKDSAVNLSAANTVSSGAVVNAPSQKKDTADVTPSSIEHLVSAATNTVSTKKDTVANVTSPADNVVVPDSLKKTTAVIKDTLAGAASPDSIAADTAEHNWVKKYEGVKPASGNLQGVNKMLPQERKTTNQTEKVRDDSSENSGSGVMTSPGLNGKSLKRKEDKPKKQQTKAQNSANTASILSNDTTGHKVKGTNNDSISQPLSVNTTVHANTSAEKNDDSVINTTDSAISDKSALKENTTPVSNGNPSASSTNVIGKTAEVNSKGEWEKAIIIDKETEFLYKVHYAGKSADKDEWVAVTQIRNIDSTANTPRSNKPVKPTKATVNCNFNAPAPPVLNADKFSEKLAKRKIYDSYLTGKNGNNSVKTGITFLSFKSETPYVNTVSISGNNSLEVKLSLAPPGAMIYPVTTEFKVCEQVAGKTSSKTLNGNYACFRNKEGSWACARIE